MKKINTIIIAALLLCFAVLNMLKMGSATYSEREQRELAAFPEFSFASLTDGSYFSEIEAFVSDHFYNRDALIDMNGAIGTAISDNPVKNAAQTKDGVNTSVVKFDLTSNPVVRSGDRLFFVFEGREDSIKNYTSAVNKISEKFGAETNVSVMLVPTVWEFFDGAAKKFGVEPQGKMIRLAQSELNKNLKFIDVSDNLEKHKSEYIYFKSDHHWTALGAYYGYEKYAEEAGIEKVKCDIYPSSIFHGSFINYINDPSILEISDVLYLYNIKSPNWCHGSLSHAEDAVQMGSMYCYDKLGYTRIFGGDTGYIRVETTHTTGRRLMVIKDSYANALVPYLTEYYDRIIMVDPRYIEDDVGKLSEEEGITDVLFVNNTETISDDAFIAKLQEMAVR